VGKYFQFPSQTIKPTKTPNPTTTLHIAFPPVSINELPLFVVAGVGVVVGLVVADPDGEAATEPEDEVVGLAAGLDVDPVPEDLAEDDEVSAVDDGREVVAGVEEGVDFGGAVLELGLGLRLGLGLEPAATTTPPCALPAELDEEVPAAADL